MDDQVKQLQQETNEIKKRNRSVESDKGWEVSKFRIFTIFVITYIIASLVLFLIRVDNFLLGALIPTIGYFLSTLTLPIIKKWWIKKYFQK